MMVIKRLCEWPCWVNYGAKTEKDNILDNILKIFKNNWYDLHSQDLDNMQKATGSMISNTIMHRIKGKTDNT